MLDLPELTMFQNPEDRLYLCRSRTTTDMRPFEGDSSEHGIGLSGRSRSALRFLGIHFSRGYLPCEKKLTRKNGSEINVEQAMNLLVAF